MTIEDEVQLDKLKTIGAIVRETLDIMQVQVRPGISTQELDDIGAKFLDEKGARSAPQLAYDFPSATCISVNDIVAHGIAGDYVLQDGDIVNIDVSAEKDGLWADSGRSMPVGAGHGDHEALCVATKTALRKGLYAAKVGQKINAIGRIVEKEAAKSGYNIIQELCGHGVGGSIHEEPSIPHYYDIAAREKLTKGLVITLEPFLTKGTSEIYQDTDGWTLRTVDKTVAAQFEHTIVVTKGAPIIIT